MDQTTQRNAALVEQSAAAAEGLRQEAQRLVDVVAAFRLQHA
jgi:methyl-accepting chemotaxis protein